MLVPISKLPGVVWPAIGDGNTSQAMALQFQLAQTQWWSAEELLTMQFKQLGPLLQHAYKNNEFYQMFYRSRSFRPKHLLSQELWQSIPIVSREAIQLAGKKINSKNVPAQHGKGSETSTSGSTGRQITVLSNQVTNLFSAGLNLRDHLWQKRNFRGKLAVIRLASVIENSEGALHPDGVQANNWGSSTSIYHTGPSVLLDINTNISEQVTWLVKQNPHYLLTYPSNLSILLGQIQQQEISLPNLQQVRTLGEIVPQQLRELCFEVLGVPLIDGYSCQEAGCLALQCPDYEHYHVQSESVLLEVLNDNDKSCKVGEIGRVVITSLHNYSTPLIRYEIGDRAEVGERCVCGRGHPVIKRILGRVRNILTFPNGETHWPFFGSNSFSGIADIRQFQLIQTELDHIDVNLVVGNPLDKKQEALLTEFLHKDLGYQFKLSFIYRDEINRSAGGKFEEFISKL